MEDQIDSYKMLVSFCFHPPVISAPGKINIYDKIPKVYLCTLKT